MTEVWLPLLGGLVLLLGGGELLVRGAVNVATRLGVSPLVIGLTLVGFGTSTPELVTSVQAALSGSPGIAYGNIVGSKIANILGIGGFTALTAPGPVPETIVGFDSLVMTGVSILLLVFGFTGRVISRPEGAVLLPGYLAYVRAIWP